MSRHKPIVSLEYRNEILDKHLNIHQGRAVSYLPIDTIIHILNLSIDEYVSMIEERGHRAMVLDSQECCIKSGAVYAYSCCDLGGILKNNQHMLSKRGWPATSDEFIKRIAAQWQDRDDDLCEIIRSAFGDCDRRVE